MPGIKVYFSNREGSSKFNGKFLPTGLRAILDGKVQMALYILFPLVFGSDSTFLGPHDDTPLVHIHVLFYTSMFNPLLSKNYSNGL